MSWIINLPVRFDHCHANVPEGEVDAQVKDIWQVKGGRVVLADPIAHVEDVIAAPVEELHGDEGGPAFAQVLHLNLRIPTIVVSVEQWHVVGGGPIIIRHSAVSQKHGGVGIPLIHDDGQGFG